MGRASCPFFSKTSSPGTCPSFFRRRASTIAGSSASAGCRRTPPASRGEEDFSKARKGGKEKKLADALGWGTDGLGAGAGGAAGRSARPRLRPLEGAHQRQTRHR